MLFHVITSVITAVKSLGATGVVSLGGKEGFPEIPAPALLPNKLPWGPPSPSLPPPPIMQPTSTLTVPAHLPRHDLCPRRTGASSLPSWAQSCAHLAERSSHCSSRPSAGPPGPQQLQVGNWGGVPSCWALRVPLCLFIYYDFLVQLDRTSVV